MKMTSSFWSPGFTLSLVVGMLLACGSIRKDEFICENAVSRLQECCPGFDPHAIGCTYDRGCFGGATYPELDSTQSDSILSDSCEVLRNSGVCGRVAALPGEGLEEADSSAPVCGTTSSPVDGVASGPPDVADAQSVPDAAPDADDAQSAPDAAPNAAHAQSVLDATPDGDFTDAGIEAGADALADALERAD
jgi:hypothetical protein